MQSSPDYRMICLGMFNSQWVSGFQFREEVEVGVVTEQLQAEEPSDADTKVHKQPQKPQQHDPPGEQHVTRYQIINLCDHNNTCGHVMHVCIYPYPDTQWEPLNKPIQGPGKVPCVRNILYRRFHCSNNFTGSLNKS